MFDGGLKMLPSDAMSVAWPTELTAGSPGGLSVNSRLAGSLGGCLSDGLGGLAQQAANGHGLQVLLASGGLGRQVLGHLRGRGGLRGVPGHRQRQERTGRAVRIIAAALFFIVSPRLMLTRWICQSREPGPKGYAGSAWISGQEISNTVGCSRR